jgi:FAD/FMN-containing dehydrogenase
LGFGAKPVLLVEVRNTITAVERQVTDISKLAKSANLPKIERIPARDQQKALWHQVSDFGYRQNNTMLGEDTITVKAGILPTHLAPALDFAKQLAARAGFDLTVMAHAGHGLVYFTAKPSSDATAAEFIHTFSRKLEAMRGSVTVERAPLSLKQKLGDVWGQALSEGEVKLMREFKFKLDPNKTLSPGRFVAGI